MCRGRRSFQFARRHRVEIVDEAAAFAAEIRRCQSCRRDDFHGFGRGGAHLLLRRFRMGRRFQYDAAQFFLRARRGERRSVFLLEKFTAQRKDAVADIPLAPFVDAFFHESGHPAQQVAVGGDRFDERVGALGQHRGRFDFDIVVQVDAQFFDECAQDALEKGVDGQHREARIVMQNPRAGFCGAFAHRRSVHLQFLAQTHKIGAFAARGQQVYFFQNARLHLFGGLVGKGHGQDVTVECGLLHHVVHIFVGQLVSFARSGACIQNFSLHNPFFALCG